MTEYLNSFRSSLCQTRNSRLDTGSTFYKENHLTVAALKTLTFSLLSHLEDIACEAWLRAKNTK